MAEGLNLNLDNPFQYISDIADEIIYSSAEKQQDVNYKDLAEQQISSTEYLTQQQLNLQFQQQQNKEKLITYGLIGGGSLLVIIILVIIAKI